MTRSVAATLLVLLAVLTTACREEPTIVIKFEPNDLATAAKAADMSAPPKAADLAVAAAPVEKKKGKAAECKVAADCVVEPLD
ncbi:MAG TPA: hypothetical protein VF945_01630, partial [Polyangia bacterium]